MARQARASPGFDSVALVTRSISIPPGCMGCQSIAGFPPELNSPVPACIHLGGGRHC